MLKTISVILAVAAIPSSAHGEQALVTAVARATMAVRAYAFEAFPKWAASNPSTTCPARLEDLAAFISGADVRDPWGHRYAVYCGATLPTGARGLAVSSSGPDGKEGTSDDIASWK